MELIYREFYIINTESKQFITSTFHDAIQLFKKYSMNKFNKQIQEKVHIYHISFRKSNLNIKEKEIHPILYSICDLLHFQPLIYYDGEISSLKVNEIQTDFVCFETIAHQLCINNLSSKPSRISEIQYKMIVAIVWNDRIWLFTTEDQHAREELKDIHQSFGEITKEEIFQLYISKSTKVPKFYTIMLDIPDFYSFSWENSLVASNFNDKIAVSDYYQIIEDIHEVEILPNDEKSFYLYHKDMHGTIDIMVI